MTGLSLQKNVDSCLEPEMAFTKTRHNKFGREDAESVYSEYGGHPTGLGRRATETCREPLTWQGSDSSRGDFGLEPKWLEPEWLEPK